MVNQEFYQSGHGALRDPGAVRLRPGAGRQVVGRGEGVSTIPWAIPASPPPGQGQRVHPRQLVDETDSIKVHGYSMACRLRRGPGGRGRGPGPRGSAWMLKAGEPVLSPAARPRG